MDDAIEHFRRAIELEPERVETHLNLAGVLAQRGKADGAVACYRRALALKPDAVEAHHDLGVALLTQGQFDQALAHFQQALTLDPNLAQAHLNIGNVFLAQGRFEKAVASYERGLAINPGSFLQSQHSLGLALAMQGKHADAVPRFERAIALNADFSGAYNDLARTLSNLDRFDEALDVLARGIVPALVQRRAKGCSCSSCAKIVACSLEIQGLSAPLSPFGIVRAMEPAQQGWSRCRAVIAKKMRPSNILVARATSAWPRRLSASELWGGAGFAMITSHQLLGTLLKSAQVCDLPLERFLTNVRFALLEIAMAPVEFTVASEQVLSFCCALAQQCFLNEYVYACTDEEAIARVT